VIPIMGIRGETITDVAQRLLAHHGGLRGLFRLDVAELARIRGLSDAKAVRLKAAPELGGRLAAFSDDRPRAGTPNDLSQDPSIVGTPAENPGAVVAESGSVRAVARQGGARPPQVPFETRDFCAFRSASNIACLADIRLGILSLEAQYFHSACRGFLVKRGTR
jgi:hypothetical protein